LVKILSSFSEDMNAIEVINISKTYSSTFKKNNVNALSDLNLAVPRGIIFGLLGPNGAGKTTLIKILLSICFPTSGNAKILAEEINNYKLKTRIGYLPEDHKFPPYLKGGEVLKYFGKLSGLEGKNLDKKIDELLELVKMAQWKKYKVKGYSKGMMQRLGIAQSLINDPELIFLDEPTDGVDPIGRKEIRDLLSDLKLKNKTVFLNSHLLSEVEMISDRVAILNKGKLIREGTVKELIEKKHEYLLEFEKKLDDEFYINLASQFNFAQIKDNQYVALVYDVLELNKLIDTLRRQNINLKEIIQKKSTLEEMFINLINEAEKYNKK
jgi:ABC-2 type transport system ATP-binding protein